FTLDGTPRRRPEKLTILSVDEEELILAFRVNVFQGDVKDPEGKRIDAEGEDEFFFIYGEDGELLGTTARGTVQCETVVTTDTLPAFLFTKYARDGIVTFTLEPNIPADRPGTFAVNNLCEGGTTARAELVQPVFRLTEIVYEVDIDGAGFEIVDPVDTVFSTLGIGLHQITYRATDCGGNTDECLFTLTVEDREPPVVTCPADIDVVLSADSCQITLEIPAPIEVTDNCEPYELSFETTEEAFLPFFFDPNLGTFLAGETSLTLTEAPPNPLDSIDLDVSLTGAFANRRALLDVVLPDGTVIGSSQRGVAACDSTGIFRIRLAGTDFTEQSTAGNLTLHLRPRPVTVPPASAGDGIIPCAEDVIANDGDSDGITRVSIAATYRTLYPDYFTTGATVTPTTSTNPAQPLPLITFNQGVTDFSYVVTDQGGNTDTCTISVTVQDTTAPVAICQPTTIFVDPSGLSPITVDPAIIDNGSFDNCGIDSFLLAPNTFACDQYGETANVTLTIMDMAGNTDSCTTIVSVAPLEPQPTATTSVCGGDTLRLFANPPTVADPGQTIYTFQWFNPAGDLISTQENFFIPGIDADSDGAYRVEIRGITGCEATGIVNVAVGELPNAPVISAPMSVCIGEDASLRSETVYAGNVRYEWFRGQPGAGVLVGESTTATFGAPFADGTASGTFYAIVFVNGCASPPSNVVSVGTTDRPTATIEATNLTACELEDAVLSGVALAGVSYEWTGPNGFLASGREVVLDDLELNDAGIYYLRTIREEGCFSLADSVTLAITPADESTSLLPTPRVCPSDTLELIAEDASGTSYMFLGPDGQEFTTDGPILRVAPITDAVIGEWRVRIQRNACFSAASDPVTVSLGTSPQANSGTIPDPVCEGNDLILQGASNIAGSSYSWTGPNGYSAAGIAPMIPEVTTANAGDYVLTVTSPTGCFSSDTLTVDVLPGIRIDSIVVTSGRCLQGGEPVSLSANISPDLPEGYTYQWTGPEGTSSAAVFEIPSVSLASNGTYSLTVVNPAGCASPRFSMPIEFDFAPAAPVRPFSLNGETSICEGETLNLQTNDFGPGTTYLWGLADGSNLPTQANSLTLLEVPANFSGEFNVRVLRNGCASLPSESRTITVTPFPELIVGANDPACSGQEINFQATDIPGATYFWQGPNNFSSSLPDPTIVSADASVHAGLYGVVATVNGCSSDTMQLAIEVRPTPRVPVALPVDPICISNSESVLSLSVNANTATEGATYQWFIQNGMVAVGAPTEELTLDITDFGLFAGGGLFSFQVSALANGCESQLSVPINVRIDEAGDAVADAGRDTVVCEGIYLLEAGPFSGGSGRWTLVQGTGDISIANPGSALTAVSGLTEQGGPYQFAWTLSDGSCLNYSADTVTVSVTDGEEAIAGENLLACVGQDLQLNATPVMMNGSAGEWSQGLAQEILGVVIVDPSDPNTAITGIQADNVYSFTWTVTSSCGVKSDNVLVNVSDPSPFAGADTIVCNDEATAFLNADAPTLGSVGQWLAVNPATFIDEPDVVRTMVGNLQIGDNLFVWEVDGGACGPRSRDTIIVTYSPSPAPANDLFEAPFQGSVTFDPAANDDLPEDAVIAFADLPDLEGDLVDNGDGTFTFTAPPNFAGDILLLYEVLSTGCELTTATVTIAVGKDVACDIPNIFTPNNDGMNDFFVVPCLLNVDQFPNSQVTIYNQWGDEVFRSERPYRNDWDGTFQGNQLPVATYFYIIDFGDSRDTESGDVRIER
ncbi:MAG: gliding motility-associated C-terminal domain-containing protein, partial [Bacteroidota bacterium]